MTETLFDIPAPTPVGWRNRRDDKDHQRAETGGGCVDPRCAQFRRVYPVAFRSVLEASIAAGCSEFNADRVRAVAQNLVPDLQPCHVNAIGHYWTRWAKEGLIEVIGAGRSSAKSANGTLYHAYRPVVSDQLAMFEVPA